MIKPGTPLYGVTNGADPLRVEVPEFSVRSIRQSTPVPGTTNTVYVTLTANYDLGSQSTITMTGLTGSQTQDTGMLDILDQTSSSCLAGAGIWTQAGDLVLRPGPGGMVSGSACGIAFSLQNSDSDQPSPSVQVSAEIKDGSGNAVGEIAQSEMAKPGMELYGVEDGTDPLKVALPEFGIKSIQQSTPVSGANNTLTVTLMANYHLGSGSRVTVSGLMGSQTADAAHLAVESTSDGIRHHRRVDAELGAAGASCSSLGRNGGGIGLRGDIQPAELGHQPGITVGECVRRDPGRDRQ
jgi:hypothetical protein